MTCLGFPINVFVAIVLVFLPCGDGCNVSRVCVTEKAVDGTAHKPAEHVGAGDCCRHNYTSIDQAIAMAGNATIVLLEGSHEVSKPIVLSNIARLRLTGLGYRLSLVNITSMDGGFRLINSTNVTLSNFSVRVATSKQAVTVSSSHHVTFDGVAFRHLLGNSQAVSLHNSDQVSFHNCSFEGPSQEVESKTRIGVDIAFLNFNRNK